MSSRRARNGRAKSESSEESGEEEYTVEKILDKRVRGNKTEYYIKWEGFNKESDNTWEEKGNLSCPEKLKEFEKERKEEEEANKEKYEKTKKKEDEIIRKRLTASSSKRARKDSTSDEEEDKESTSSEADESATRSSRKNLKVASAGDKRKADKISIMTSPSRKSERSTSGADRGEKKTFASISGVMYQNKKKCFIVKFKGGSSDIIDMDHVYKQWPNEVYNYFKNNTIIPQ